MEQTNAHQEKHFAAASSVVAALGLTTFKFIVGLLTNSLGILAEAAHSALDMLAAVLTYISVKIADKPADKQHQFGHGKMENISALLQTVLLFFTAGWIIYEAVNRLVVSNVQVETSIWAFLVMGVSIVVDVTRSRLLRQAAEKHNSQALHADAVHFSLDIWSSVAVIVGLTLVALSRFLPAEWAWLHQADALAALVVAVIIVYVSLELGLNAIHALLDAAPEEGEQERIEKAVAALPSVNDVHAVRIRPSGANWFVDMHITVAGDMSVKASHDLTEQIETLVKSILPLADTTVHVEPKEEISSLKVEALPQAQDLTLIDPETATEPTFAADGLLVADTGVSTKISPENA